MTLHTDTLQRMDGPVDEQAGVRFDELQAEAAEALSYSANTLRAVRDRYRTAYLEDLARWQTLRDDLTSFEREGPDDPGSVATASTNGSGDGGAAVSLEALAVAAAEAGAADLRLRMVRGEVDRLRSDLGRREAELSRIELAIKSLESTWLFLERGDASLVSDSTPGTPTDVQMRIVEAQESERARLAQEVHDGPAQMLSNAIFQVEFVERVFDSDHPLARTELRFLRELLRRELGDVRGFIGQLRPPVLAELGLDGSIADAVATQSALSGLHISTGARRDTRWSGRGRPDGGPARGAGGTAECPQARRRDRCRGCEHGGRWTMGAGGPRRRSRLRCRGGRGSRSPQLRSPVHA